MSHRSGKKFGKKTTVIESAAPIVDFANGRPEVNSIILSKILKRGNSKWTVRINKRGRCLLLLISQRLQKQIIRVCSTDVDATEAAIREYARSEGYEIRDPLPSV